MSIKMILFRVIAPVVVAIALTQAGFNFSSFSFEEKPNLVNKAQVKSAHKKSTQKGDKKMTEEKRKDILWKCGGIIVFCLVGLTISRKLMDKAVGAQMNKSARRF